MKNLVRKDKKNRNFIYKYNNFRFILKNIIVHKKFNTTVRWNVISKLDNLKKTSSKTILSNRCILTGRKSSIIKKFKYSRLSLLKQARLCNISGLLKV